MAKMGILGGPVMISMGIENSISGEHRLIAPQHVLCEALVLIDLVVKPTAKIHSTGKGKSRLLEELALLCNATGGTLVSLFRGNVETAHITKNIT
jgi:hypothetical protein